MKPNGLVLAAWMTSQTSMFIRSQSIFISLTSAMFTQRKMFSSSLDSSATRVEDTGTDVLERAAVERLRHLQARRREAADNLRDGLGVEALVARVLALGAEGQVEVHARLEAALLQQRLEHLVGGARVGGGLEHEELALAHVRRQRLAGLDDVAHVRLARLRSAAWGRR